MKAGAPSRPNACAWQIPSHFAEDTQAHTAMRVARIGISDHKVSVFLSMSIPLGLPNWNQ
jgi:hypothetical protein